MNNSLFVFIDGYVLYSKLQEFHILQKNNREFYIFLSLKKKKKEKRRTKQNQTKQKHKNKKFGEGKFRKTKEGEDYQEAYVVL